MRWWRGRREGVAVACGGRTVWALALPCGMAALLTPLPVVPWRDMVTLQEANLGWMCTWHTHLAGMDPHEWQAKAVVTYLSWPLPTAPSIWAQWWDRALRWARDGSAVAACRDLPREPVAAQPWTVSVHLPTVAAWLAVVDPEVRLLTLVAQIKVNMFNIWRKINTLISSFNFFRGG